MQHRPSLSFTQHNTKDVPTIWKGLDWDSFLIGLLDAKANFTVVACMCNWESFKNLLTTVKK